MRSFVVGVLVLLYLIGAILVGMIVYPRGCNSNGGVSFFSETVVVVLWPVWATMHAATSMVDEESGPICVGPEETVSAQ